VLVRYEKWQKPRREISNLNNKEEELSDKALKHLDHPVMMGVEKSLV